MYVRKLLCKYIFGTESEHGTWALFYILRKIKKKKMKSLKQNEKKGQLKLQKCRNTTKHKIKSLEKILKRKISK